MQNNRRLRPPEFALSDFYPPDGVFNPRSWLRNVGGIASDLLASDFRTGVPLPINGTLPVICSSAVCSDRTMRLFAAAGLPDFSHAITFNNQSDYESVLADCRRQQTPVIFQYPPPEGERPRTQFWIDPDLFGQLNNKACLSDLVPEPYLPERTVLPARELPAFLNSSSTRPLVLKTATDKPGGGAPAVAVIHTDRDFETARERLEIGQQMVAEEFLSIEDHYCVNCATDGRQTFLLGCCDQITNESGQHAGHWISLVRHPPHEVIEAGFEIMYRAAKRGYVGVAGFEIVRDCNGRILAIDLNFRLGESTAAVMWQNRLLSRKGAKCVGRVIHWEFQQHIDPGFSLLHELVESGWFFPLTVYDPQASPYGFAEARAMGILFGSSRYQVEQRLQKLYRKFGVSVQTVRDAQTEADSPPKRAA